LGLGWQENKGSRGNAPGRRGAKPLVPGPSGRASPEAGWYDDNSDGKTHAAGKRGPADLGDGSLACEGQGEPTWVLEAPPQRLGERDSGSFVKGPKGSPRGESQQQFAVQPQRQPGLVSSPHWPMVCVHGPTSSACRDIPPSLHGGARRKPLPWLKPVNIKHTTREAAKSLEPRTSDTGPASRTGVLRPCAGMLLPKSLSRLGPPVPRTPPVTFAESTLMNTVPFSTTTRSLVLLSALIVYYLVVLQSCSAPIRYSERGCQVVFLSPVSNRPVQADSKRSLAKLFDVGSVDCPAEVKLDTQLYRFTASTDFETSCAQGPSSGEAVPATRRDMATSGIYCARVTKNRKYGAHKVLTVYDGEEPTLAWLEDLAVSRDERRGRRNGKFPCVG